jgi:hypothetical protein
VKIIKIDLWIIEMTNLEVQEIYQEEKEAIVGVAPKIDDQGVEVAVGAKRTCHTTFKASTTQKV